METNELALEAIKGYNEEKKRLTDVLAEGERCDNWYRVDLRERLQEIDKEVRELTLTK